MDKREGSLDAPTRHPLLWRDKAFHDEKALDAEMRRVFDVCHGCRRCFNLCDAFPRLFELIDESKTGEVDGVSSASFRAVEEACTLCDMCFMTKCPYVPPHPFAIDFPHLMLRARAASRHRGEKAPFGVRQLARMDRNALLARWAAPLVAWASARWNSMTRIPLEWILKIDRKAELPRFAFRSFIGLAKRAKRKAQWTPNKNAPAFGRKILFFPTCYVNHASPKEGASMARLLAHCGAEVEALYPTCCGMPFLEQGEIGEVAKRAETIARAMTPFLDEGYDVVSPTASCSLMMRQEWRLILPESEKVKRLSERVYDITHYLTEMARKDGLPSGARAVEGGVAVHLACHARAQNLGARAAELMRLLPDTKVEVVERCSGHGGTFGVVKPTHAVAARQARPALRLMAKTGAKHWVSECPLAAKHLAHQASLGQKGRGGGGGAPPSHAHPVALMARAYGLSE